MNDKDFESWISHSSKAIETDRMDVLRQAIKFSAQFNRDLLGVQIDNGNTLLHLACRSSRSDAVRILLQSGADPCVQNAEGHLPLELCTTDLTRHAFVMDCVQAICRSDHHRMMQHLAAGITPDTMDSPLTKNSLLHWAANRAAMECVQALIDRGADVNALNSNGMTPLHESVIRGHGAVMEELMKHGANPALAPVSGTYSNKSAVVLCRELHPELLSILAPVQDRSGLPATPLLLTHGSWDGQTSVNHDVASLMANSETNSSNDHWANDGLEGPWEGLRHVWPTPRSIQIIDNEEVSVPRETSIRLAVCGLVTRSEASRADLVLRLLKEDLESEGVVVQQHHRQTHSLCLSQHLPITLELGQQVVGARRQSYQILILHGRIRVQSATTEGLRFGCLTLLQLLTASAAQRGLPAMKIVDWPDAEDRGVLIDLSTGLLPRKDRLHQWISLVARMKCNQLHLFVRVSAGAELIRGYDFEQLRQVCDACRAQMVEPVLAIDIAATVESLEELQPAMMDQLVSCFPTDSPLHVGPRLSLYLLQMLSEPRGIGLPCWLDLRSRPRIGLCPSSASDAEKLWSLAAFPMVAMEYIVPSATNTEKKEERDWTKPRLSDHGYHEWKKKRDVLRRLGVPFSVCIGATSVTSVTGCFPRALPDLLPTLGCVNDDVTSSVVGVLSCQWSGPFPLCQPLFGLPGHICIVGLAWNTSVDPQTAMSHVRGFGLPLFLGNEETVDAFFDLAHLESQLLPVDSAPYTCLLSAASTDLRSAVENLLEHNSAVLKRVFHRSRAWARRLERSDADKDSVTTLMAYVARLLEFSCRLAFLHSAEQASRSRSGNTTTCTDLANRLITLMDEAKDMGERWFALTDRGRGAIGACFRSLLNQILPEQALSDLSRQMQDTNV